MTQVKLRLTASQHDQLRSHLLPGDGLEAVAVGLCGRRASDELHALTLHKVVPIPYTECKLRTPDRVTWSTARLVPLLQEAEKRGLAVLKLHSHPSGYPTFSSIDDASDTDLFSSVFGWTDSRHPQCSVVMLPDGSMFGRAILRSGSFVPLESILVAGDDIHVWHHATPSAPVRGYAERHTQLFGRGTTDRLQRLSVAVIGCSGTGSPVVEQLARLGVGRLVLVDPDFVEERNLNRIVSATKEDAFLRRPKTDVLARSIARMGLGTEVQIVRASIVSRAAVNVVATCDVVFGCMDGIEGRHALNRLTAFYSIPYFDIGVKLQADGKGGIDEACGAVHYLRPDGSALIDRGVYTLQQLKADGLRRTDPGAYREQVRAGYIHGIREDRPAVISVNFQLASLAVNELLSRLHPYRLDPNSESAIVRESFMQGIVYRETEPASSGVFSRVVGRGDIEPLLDMPELSIVGAPQ